MTDNEITLGEIQRSQLRMEKIVEALTNEVRDRHRTLSDLVNARVGRIDVHTVQIEAQQKAVEQLDQDVKNVTATANKISGFGALAAIVVGLLPLPWKH